MLNDDSVREALGSAPRLAALKRTGLLDSLPEEFFDRITRMAAELLNAPVAWIALVDDRRQFFKSQHGLQEPWCSQRESPLSHSICQQVVASARTLAIEDTSTHELVASNRAVQELNVRSYAGAPLITAEGLALGTLCVNDTQPRQFTEHEVQLLVTLASSIAAEINLRLAHCSLSQSEARSQAIFDRSPLGIMLVGSNGHIMRCNPRACVLTGYAAGDLLGMDVLELSLHESEPGEPSDRSRFESVWSREMPFAEWESRFRCRRDEGWFWARLHVALVLSPGSDFTVVMFEDITQQREASLKLSRQASQLEMLSLTDPLTGINNRRGFASVGEQMLKGATRRGETSVLLFFDLDGLKKANDQLGHEAGDLMIAEMAGLLKSTFRESDLLGRWGGDEFVVLATGLVPGDVEHVLARLTEARDKLQATRQFPFQLAASVGSAFSPDPSDGQAIKLEEMIRRADAAMYEDKRRHYAQGRIEPQERATQGSKRQP